jgi:pyrroloquinoline quinone biosynthesis protein B
MGSIPHPLVTDTLYRLQGLGDRVALIHMNHTNPCWDLQSEASRKMAEAGFSLGRQGDVYPL